MTSVTFTITKIIPNARTVKITRGTAELCRHLKAAVVHKTESSGFTVGGGAGICLPDDGSPDNGTTGSTRVTVSGADKLIVCYLLIVEMRINR